MHRYLDLFLLIMSRRSFFTLCINVFTLLDCLASSGKPFQIKGSKYGKHFWLRAQSFSSSRLEEFERRISSIALIGCCVNFVEILRTHFREEFKNACRKTLFESLVYWKPVNLVKMFSSDVLSVVQLKAETYRLVS